MTHDGYYYEIYHGLDYSENKAIIRGKAVNGNIQIENHNSAHKAFLWMTRIFNKP